MDASITLPTAGKKGNVVLTKNKYHQIQQQLKDILDQDMLYQVLQVINDTLGFDPDTSTYTKRHADAQKSLRRRQQVERLQNKLETLRLKNT